MPQVHCVIRRAAVAALPEELVRQGVLCHLIEERGFPRALIGVEVPLKQLVLRSSAAPIPNRRVDIVCFVNQGSSLAPFLLIECKAVKLSSRAMNQVVGYNYFIQAPYIAIVNAQEARVGIYDRAAEEYQFVDYFPHY